MLRFKNKDNLPVTPKSWKAPNGTRIAFDSVRQTWEQFVQRVWNYCEANGVPKPTIFELEDIICHQMAGWACISSEEYASRQSAPRYVTPQPVRRGCSSCGGRKKP